MRPAAWRGAPGWHADAEDRGPDPPDAQLEADEVLDRFLAALAELPPRSEEVVRLRLQAGLSYKDIAALTDLSVSHVGVILHEAMTELRAAVAPEHATPRKVGRGTS